MLQFDIYGIDRLCTAKLSIVFGRWIFHAHTPKALGRVGARSSTFALNECIRNDGAWIYRSTYTHICNIYIEIYTDIYI